MTDPNGGRSWLPPPSPPAGRPPPAGSVGRLPRWAAVGVPVVLVAGIAVLLAAYLVVDGRGSDSTRPIATGAPGSAVPPSALSGTWSGDGSLTDCAGFDKGCPEVRAVALTIDCSDEPCTVTPFDPSYGRPSLRFTDGSYLAAGPVPANVAPRCGGVPTSSALWRLRLTVEGARLQGSYAESTVQGFDCGATHVRWEVTLARG